MKNTPILLVGLGFIIISGTVFVIGSRGNSTASETSSKSQQKSGKEGEISPRYVWNSKANFAKAQREGKTVIYFWASWCPTCRVLDIELTERSSELPDDVTILKTNYDTERELKKKYQIVQQHTLVLVDNNGNEINRWIGGNFDLLKQQLQ